MALCHTRVVRLEAGTTMPGIVGNSKAKDMRQIKSAILSILRQNHTNFSLHSPPAIDIKPIVTEVVFGQAQRHCSTTFYP